MTAIEQRVRHALGNAGNQKLSPWAALMALYRADREAFYMLACDGVGNEADAGLSALADLASQIRFVVRSTYQIEPGESLSEAILHSRSGGTLVLPASMVTDIKRFLLEVDGKSVSSVPGKDFVGTPISEAEARFKLGDRSTWEADRKRLQIRRNAEPFVLRLDPQDLNSLKHQPAYVRHGLLHCATKTVLAPTVVFQGLNRGEGSPERLRNGWIYCGKPRRTYDNSGQSQTSPDDMMYLVYVDHDGFVFDWDWVKENPGDSGYPIDWQLRFGNPVTQPVEATIEIPANVPQSTFDPSKACYSRKGDCIFCYLTDSFAYAERINSDLTVFREVGTENVAGFKIKNVQRIVQQNKGVILSNVPDLLVSVLGVLVASFHLKQGARLEVYDVTIGAYYSHPSHPKEVTLPKPEAQAPEPATC